MTDEWIIRRMGKSILMNNAYTAAGGNDKVRLGPGVTTTHDAWPDGLNKNKTLRLKRAVANVNTARGVITFSLLAPDAATTFRLGSDKLQGGFHAVGSDVEWNDIDIDIVFANISYLQFYCYRIVTGDEFNCSLFFEEVE